MTKLPEPHKKAISNSLKGKKKPPRSDAHKKKLSESKMGINNPNFGKPWTEERKEKLRQSKRGKKHSEETKQKISQSRTGKYTGELNHNFGKPLPDALKEVLRQRKVGLYDGEKHPMFGIPRSDITKQRMSIALTGKFKGELNPSFGIPKSEETRRRISEARRGQPAHNKGVPMSLEQRNRISVSMTGRFAGEKHPMWEGGISRLPYPPGWSKQYRNEVRHAYGCMCPLCFKTTAQNGWRLDVHHIDHNKNNIAITNLIPLCKQCHGNVKKDKEYYHRLFTELVAGRFKP
jgi:hypothetical protein